MSGFTPTPSAVRLNGTRYSLRSANPDFGASDNRLGSVYIQDTDTEVLNFKNGTVQLSSLNPNADGVEVLAADGVSGGTIDAGELHSYNLSVDASNYERHSIKSTERGIEILGESAGTGSSRGAVLIGVNAGGTGTASDNVCIGPSAGSALTGLGKSNVFIGSHVASAGNLNSSGAINNVAIGNSAGYYLRTSAKENVLIGHWCGYRLGVANRNIFIGPRCGVGASTNQTTNGSVFIGYEAGYDETGDNTLIIDNQDRGSESNGRMNSLIYGLFNSTKANQLLRFNTAYGGSELSSDPADPSEGTHVFWQSDGTGSGDDGDIMMKITAGGVTKTVTLVDFSSV